MNTLRWILAVGVVLLMAAYGIFFVVGNNFRKSFGASETNPLLLVVPLIVGGLLAWWIVPLPRVKSGAGASGGTVSSTNAMMIRGEAPAPSAITAPAPLADSQGSAQ